MANSAPLSSRRPTTEQEYIDHWNKVVENEEEDLATFEKRRARELELCKRENERDKALEKLFWILGDLPLPKGTMDPLEVREFLDKWSGEGKDYNGERFTVVFIGEDGNQHRHHCYPLTIGKYGFGGGSDINPWAKGEDICIVTDCESADGVSSCVCDIIEFKMDAVISIVTCEKFKSVLRRYHELEYADIHDSVLGGASPTLMSAL